MDRVIKKKTFTLKKVAIYGLSGAFVLFVIYSFVFADRSSKLNVSVDKINVAEVQNGEFREFIPVDGQVMPIKTIRLDAIEGGIIEKKFYEGGIQVEKGDTILKLTNNNLLQSFIREETQAFILMNQLQNTRLQMQQSLFQLQRTLITLDYQIAQAKDLYERSEQLFKEKVISEQEFLRAKLDYERLIKTRVVEVKSQKVDSLNAENTINNSQALLQRTNNNLNMIRQNLENLYIRAPISGRLSTVNGEVGESISPGQNIGQIDDTNGFKVRAQIDEHYLARIYEGLKGTFDFAGGTYELTIMKNYGEVRNGLFEVDMYFEGDVPDGIRRGQTLQIRLQLSENIQAIQIPRGSFYQTTGGNWIFVVDASGDFATRRNIRLGRQNPRFYEVLEGLQPGEKVVVSSYEGYQDKDRLVFK
ncbi:MULTISPECIES: efflux RND transporter periplasmic adaptor subunit [unclassified Imperialibacter]|uniref:efflux RND transporter periplasmic adaptor subunit n=1 Tax=unclassified Imperialibacter TaxID=2629706 RepID=UPI0012599E89|nr:MULTISPECIES: efflux RND transporter periplasmic adaptor subunit [unclassified Imperialibacter]CAD5292706.1 HlyD family secretion protein [Imperialibacter sp. 89]CAD5293763.1 HlyD family secretion protein [Imperialibacter sp. 75]VVT28691.1 Efflux transporter periplasmic adaptor subunit [Imperialibacter sp. EC-SDR9]